VTSSLDPLDVVGAIDIVMPRAMNGEIDATRRYVMYCAMASERIIALMASAHPGMQLGPISRLLETGLLELSFTAPHPTGRGLLRPCSTRHVGSSTLSRWS
jgi:hypothetical protein